VTTCLNEGRVAWDDARKALNGEPGYVRSPAGKNWGAPVGEMTFSEDLTLGIRGLVMDQGKTGGTGHTGSKGDTMQSRTSYYGKGSRLGENLQYGATTSGTDIIMQLYIDAGVPNRGHRDNIMDGNFKITGIFSGPHPKFKFETGIQYGDVYTCNEACKATKAEFKA